MKTAVFKCVDGYTLNIAEVKKNIASPLKQAIEQKQAITLVYESDCKVISKYKGEDGKFIKVDNSSIEKVVKTNTFNIRDLKPYGEHPTVKAFKAGKEALKESLLKEGVTLPEKKERVNPYSYAKGYEGLLLICETADDMAKQCKLSIAVDYGNGDTSTSVYEVVYTNGETKEVSKEELLEKHIISSTSSNAEFEATQVLALTLDCNKIKEISVED